MKQSKITIVGGGIVGLTMAAMLAPLPVDVEIIESQKLNMANTAAINSRTAALMTGSLAVLEQALILPEILENGAPLRTMQVIDDSRFPDGGDDDLVKQAFHASEMDKDYFGYNIPLDRLKNSLLAKVQSLSNIKISDEFDLSKDQSPFTNADLVIAADGRDSFVRQHHGISATRKDYGQTAITCVIKHSGDHQDTSTEFHRNGGPCTFVPMGNHISTVVWVEKTDDANGFMGMSEPDFTKALQARTRNILGEIELIVSPQAWPLIALKADQLIAPRTLFMAEAAHVFSPIGAQGLNLSLRDVQTAYNMIKQAMLLGQDIGSDTVLQDYQQSRQPDIDLRYNAVNGLNDMVQNKFLNRVRRLGLQTLSFSPLRSIMMDIGLGKTVNH